MGGELGASATRVRASSTMRAHRVEVGAPAAREGQVDDGVGPAAREVAEQADVAVGDDVERAVDRPEPGEPHGHVLDDARHAADGDGVADVVLVLHGHEDAREVVADDLLRAEAEGGADDGGAGQQRGQVDAEHAEHDGAGHDEDEEAPDVGHEARHGGDPRRPARGEPDRPAAWSATRSSTRRMALAPSRATRRATRTTSRMLSGPDDRGR